MTILSNIRSIAKYESKLLLRSWFFRIFAVLMLIFLFFYNFIMLTTGEAEWSIISIASNIPYINLLFMNLGQAIIAIFLSSDFLKRDTKMDTSEVFYVRPVSNAEYVIGKIWGNLKIFFSLNLIVMGIAILFTFIGGVAIDWAAYATYFLFISVPTLIFIIGFSIFLMSLFRNQAVTFILLLGYVGLTVFYLGNKFHYIFDYMTYSTPLLKSSIVGFTNLGILINHRFIYLLAGLSFIMFSIAMFRRLSNTARGKYIWMSLAGITLAVGATAAFRHVADFRHAANMRKLYTEINNRYVHTPKMVVDEYTLTVEQHPGSISGEATLKGVALQDASKFTFCLNPSLKVREVTGAGKALPFERDYQIITVDWGKEAAKGDTIELTISYDGTIDELFCYLDIAPEVIEEQYADADGILNVAKAYYFMTDDYLLLTPEACWYPRPGTTYSDESADWQQTYFSRFKINVKPLPGLMPVVQGEGSTSDSITYAFAPEYAMQAATVIAGRYRKISTKAGGIDYTLYYIDGHDYFSSVFDSIPDTIPGLIRIQMENLQRNQRLEYPFKRFTVVETPAQLFSYQRMWTQAQEVLQPEMALLPEKGWNNNIFDFKTNFARQMRWRSQNNNRGGGRGGRGGNRQATDRDVQAEVLNGFMWVVFQMGERTNVDVNGRAEASMKTIPNPYFLFPQLYNFRYNIFSEKWPVANRLIEKYLQNQGFQGMMWGMEGISPSEKANLLMGEHPFTELLVDTDPERRELLDNIISQKASRLLAPAEVKVGVISFRDSVYAVLKRNSFRNILFENLLDTLSMIGDTLLKPGLDEWDKPTPMPYYLIGTPSVTSVNDRGMETYVLKLMVSNLSEYDGIIGVETQARGGWGGYVDPRTNRKIKIPAKTNIEIVSLWDEPPRNMTVNTLVSANLPQVLSLPTGRVIEGFGGLTDKEGDFVVPELPAPDPNEIIVDNESKLFSCTSTASTGLIAKLIQKMEVSDFKYVTLRWWNPPRQWVPTINDDYYGDYIRSAYVIRSGKGNQTATWRVPLRGQGSYEVYYRYANAGTGRRYDDWQQASYRFKIHYNGDEEEANLNLRRLPNGWQRLGTYYFTEDTVQVTLSNQCEQRAVSADAVKFIKIRGAVENQDTTAINSEQQIVNSEQ